MKITKKEKKKEKALRELLKLGPLRKESCQCESCTRHRKYRMLKRGFTRNGDAFVRKLLNLLLNVEMDANYYEIKYNEATDKLKKAGIK